MKDFRFLANGKHIDTWLAWTGLIPQAGDFVRLPSGDGNGQIYKVVCREIDGQCPERITINVRKMPWP